MAMMHIHRDWAIVATFSIAEAGIIGFAIALGVKYAY